MNRILCSFEPSLSEYVQGALQTYLHLTRVPSKGADLLYHVSLLIPENPYFDHLQKVYFLTLRWKPAWLVEDFFEEHVGKMDMEKWFNEFYSLVHPLPPSPKIEKHYHSEGGYSSGSSDGWGGTGFVTGMMIGEML